MSVRRPGVSVTDVACPYTSPTLTPRLSGFTLVETVIVLAIVGIIIAFALPAYERYVEKTRIVEAINTVRTIQSRVTDFYKANGALPATLAQVGHDTTLDPWGRAYTYVIITSSAVARKDKRLAPLNSDYDLFSMGRDGASMNALSHATSRDDIVRARDGRFVGLAEDFDP